MKRDGASREGGRILVVDDFEDTRHLLKEVLEEEGFRVETAENGLTALDALQRSSFDLVLLDIRMPRMDGLRVCQSLRSSPATASLPIIFVTASTDAGLPAQALKVGASDLLQIPVAATEVIRRVRAQLGRAAVSARATPSS